MARSWVTLASQMDRLEAISVSVSSDARSERETTTGGVHLQKFKLN